MKLKILALLAFSGFARTDAAESPVEYLRPLVGADISFVPQQEAEGRKFSDKGEAKDVLEILRDHRFNWIRLRLFVDPASDKGYSKEGYCGLEQTLAMAKRVKAAGMNLLLDFHYSDTWADPGKQFTPSSWADFKGDALVEKMHEYTRGVLKRFIEEEAGPGMVQIGNEIHHGFVWPEGRIGESDETFGALLKSAGKAVREADPRIRIMVHPALGGDNERSVRFFDLVLSHGVDFDVIGQSYYPDHYGTLDQLRANLTDLATRYRKPIVVVEYKEHRKEVNEIVQALPGQLGWGTFIWEATSPRWGGLFDDNGATTEWIDLYPEFVASTEKTKGPPLDSGPMIKVIEEGGTGPHPAVATEEPSLPGMTIFQPRDLAPFVGKTKLPVLLWGNGACANTAQEHKNFLNEIASHGYLVLAIGPLNQLEERDATSRQPTRPGQLLAALDWITSECSNSDSRFSGHVDPSQVAAMGMSCGGLQAIQISADPRIRTSVICNSGVLPNPSPMPGMPPLSKDALKDFHAPVLYLMGGPSDIAYANAMDDFRRVDHVPIAMANLDVGHGGTYSRPHGGKYAPVALAWLDWHLKKDDESSERFLGPDSLSTRDPEWTLETKNFNR